jgi:hypothetical protein
MVVPVLLRVCTAGGELSNNWQTEQQLHATYGQRALLSVPILFYLSVHEARRRSSFRCNGCACGAGNGGDHCRLGIAELMRFCVTLRLTAPAAKN